MPYVKTGGLADVAGALPVALTELGVRVKLFMPLYDRIRVFDHGFVHADDLGECTTEIGGETIPFHVWYGHLPGSDVEVHLIDCPRYFHRGSIYTESPDEVRRFVLLQRAAFHVMQRYNWAPDVIHANDWQAGLMPSLLRHAFSWDRLFQGTASVLSIHNIGYQGWTSPHLAYESGLPGHMVAPGGPYESNGALSCLKAGISEADMVSTVSPTYAQEIQTPRFGEGLDDLLRQRAGDLRGILNGIDTKAWDPANDPLVPHAFSATKLTGKALNRTALLSEFGLSAPDEVPVFGIVSRLASQKGFDMLSAVLDDVLRRADFRLVVLGSGDPGLEGWFRHMTRLYADRIAVHIGYDEGLSHRIEAGSDVFLMPSHYEPCGLNQMYSMRYGTLPLVHHTGGLADTVVDLDADPKRGNGFSFWDARPPVLADTMIRAVDSFADRKRWQAAMRRGMKTDFSWEHAARAYMDLYSEAIGRHRQ